MQWKKQGVFHVIQKSEVTPIWTNFERHWKNSDIREYIYKKQSLYFYDR